MARADRDRRYLSWRFMALMGILLVLGFCAAMHWVRADIRELEAAKTTLQLRVNIMDMELADLQDQLKRMGSDGYVENEARENYGFIREGEIIFAFEDPDVLKGYTEEEYRIIMEELRD